MKKQRVALSTNDQGGAVRIRVVASILLTVIANQAHSYAAINKARLDKIHSETISNYEGVVHLTADELTALVPSETIGLGIHDV